ncbi:hypothetical protein [Flavobacterium beibuense]|uniref:hypothetical protein n=1 Tax=Flavobacterium beibuense TaxID=657326 RepID=UPI003A952502
MNLLRIGCIIIFIIGSIGITTNVQKKLIQLNGKEVKVAITQKPYKTGFGKRKTSDFKFDYQGKTYTKRVEYKYRDTLINQPYIILKTNDDNSVFVYRKEEIDSELTASALLMIISLICFFKAKKTRGQ